MKPKNETCKERINRNLKSREEDFLRFMNNYDEKTREEFYSYGLSFDFVELSEYNKEEEYYRYQLSWGGPSDEIRIYKDKVNYVFMDWFDYADKDITQKNWVKWLVSDFQELEMLPLNYGGLK